MADHEEDIKEFATWMIREAWVAEKKVDTKANAADLVTETDQKVEEYIISTFKSKFPDHKFIGEESVAAGIKCDLTDAPTWIIDPVDGTTNFVHRFPFSCVSIALAINKKIEVGVVYNPILDEMFTARSGCGAYCNDKKLKVTDTKDLNQALIMCEFGSQRDSQVLDAKFRTMRNILNKAHGLRCMGSTALGICYVGAGWADIYTVITGIDMWDVAAAYLVAREAGAVVCDVTGKMASC